MGTFNVRLIFFAMLICHSVIDNSEAKLRKLLIIFRHGDRAPAFQPYPTNPNRYYLWENGLENLTYVGKTQAFDLGKYIGQKYNFFTHNTNEVFARSSSHLRCIQTTACVLTGIYTPNNTEDCYENTGLATVPVYAVVPEKNNLMLSVTTACQKLNLAQKKSFSTSQFLNKMKKQEPFLQRLRKLTGLPDLAYTRIFEIYDTTVVESAHNLTLDNWVRELLPEMAAATRDITDALTDLGEVSKLLTGSLLRDIILRMHEDAPDYKLYLYGTHDILIQSLMKQLEVFNGILVPYAAAVIIEVHTKEGMRPKEDDYIQIYYRNSSAVEPYRMPIGGCSEPCTVKSFTEMTKSRVVNNIKKECS